MRFRRKTFIPSAVVRLLIVGAYAIALAIACTPASAAPSAAAPSADATTAPQPQAASSQASVNAPAGGTPPDARTVISYLSDVINWYGHLGVEAQLVRDPDETLFFADDRQTAGEVLGSLSSTHARKQRTLPRPTPAPPPRIPAAGSAGDTGLANVVRSLDKLDAAANKLRTRIKVCRRSLRRRRPTSALRSHPQIEGAQNELDLNQARVDAFNALKQYESGSAPDQSVGLFAQIDELEHSISDSSKKTRHAGRYRMVAAPSPRDSRPPH